MPHDRERLEGTSGGLTSLWEELRVDGLEVVLVHHPTGTLLGGQTRTHTHTHAYNEHIIGFVPQSITAWFYMVHAGIGAVVENMSFNHKTHTTAMPYIPGLSH